MVHCIPDGPFWLLPLSPSLLSDISTAALNVRFGKWLQPILEPIMYLSRYKSNNIFFFFSLLSKMSVFRQTLEYGQRHTAASLLCSSLLVSRDSGVADPWYTCLPALRGRQERSLCQCHNEAGGRWEKGYEVDVWGEKGQMNDSNCK